MAVAKAGAKLCPYHDPILRVATIERNRVALHRYWARWRTRTRCSVTPAVTLRRYARQNASDLRRGPLSGASSLSVSRARSIRLQWLAVTVEPAARSSLIAGRYVGGFILRTLRLGSIAGFSDLPRDLRTSIAAKFLFRLR